MDEIIRPRKWTKDELRKAEFRYFPRRKQLVMAARLPETIAPLHIQYPLETVVAEAGDVLCFEPANELRTRLSDYDHWSVKLDIFLKTYRNWDQSDWIPNPQVQFMMDRGCKPYYKRSGAWAKRLTEPTWIESLESPNPIQVPAGMWLFIGPSGEPWHGEDETFRARYVVDGQ
jgi:hypothetical protein